MVLAPREQRSPSPIWAAQQRPTLVAAFPQPAFSPPVCFLWPGLGVAARPAVGPAAGPATYPVRVFVVHVWPVPWESPVSRMVCRACNPKLHCLWIPVVWPQCQDTDRVAVRRPWPLVVSPPGPTAVLPWIRSSHSPPWSEPEVADPRHVGQSDPGNPGRPSSVQQPFAMCTTQTSRAAVPPPRMPGRILCVPSSPVLGNFAFPDCFCS